MMELESAIADEDRSCDWLVGWRYFQLKIRVVHQNKLGADGLPSAPGPPSNLAFESTKLEWGVEGAERDDRGQQEHPTKRP